MINAVDINNKLDVSAYDQSHHLVAITLTSLREIILIMLIAISLLDLITTKLTRMTAVTLTGQESS